MPQVPPSPRRSSRAARPGQTTTSNPASHNTSTAASNLSSSSSTSSLSGRERSTRSARQSPPPTKASTPTSEDSVALMATRRSRRQLESSVPADATKGSLRSRDNDDEDIAEDEETTRCVCEFQEYPGPPITTDAASTTSSSTRSAQKTASTNPNDDNEGNDDEPGSLFIQCDSCEVWQHGGCVGIMSDAATPDNYFCELCRPEFHHLAKTASGQKYSRYVPIDTKRSHRKMSGVKGEETRSAARESVKAGSAEAPKRRSTMNSRATLDEDEQLRKALEISKQEGGTGASDTSAVRKSKRGREESEDAKSDVKRQRTNSSEPSHAEFTIESPPAASDESRRKTPRSNGQGQKDKESHDAERRRERSETASKHKSRRQADDVEESIDEKPKVDDRAVDDENENVSAVVEEQNAATPANVTPQPPARKNAPNSRKRGRGGKLSGVPQREGYNDPGSPAKNGKSTDSPKENIRDGVGSEADSTTGVNGTSATNGVSATERPINGARRGRPGRDRHDGPRELTLTELKRRAAAMLEFISRSQKEMADAEMQDLRSPKVAALRSSTEISADLSKPPDKIANNSDIVMNGTTKHAAGGAATLADDLATRLVKWQQEYTGEAAVAPES